MAWSYRLEVAKQQKLTEVVRRMGHQPLDIGRHNHCRLQGHNDGTPSMYVYGDREGFYCWGCHRGGSAIDYVMGVEGIGLWEAIRRIEEMFGLRHQVRTGDGGPGIRTTMALEAAERVRKKFDGPAVDLTAYASIVEARLRVAVEGEGGRPQKIPEEVWLVAREAYQALDRCVDRKASKDEMEDLLDHYTMRVSDMGAALHGLTVGEL